MIVMLRDRIHEQNIFETNCEVLYVDDDNYILQIRKKDNQFSEKRYKISCYDIRLITN